MVLRLGNENARALKAILADIRASKTAQDLHDLQPLAVAPNGDFSLSFADSVTISAAANHLNNPTDTTGRILWSAVTRLKILSIGDLI